MPEFFDVFQIFVNNKNPVPQTDGTEAFPNLGAHCQYPDCHQLDFLPFSCNRCDKTLCLQHRTYKAHDCGNPDEKNRKMFVCEICSTAIETTGYFGVGEKAIIEKHLKSKDCDPAKKKKPRCPAHRCKQTLTFSNNVVCRNCGIKYCLDHRFPATHGCEVLPAAEPANGGLSIKNMPALGKRNGKDCAKSGRGPSSPANKSRSIESF